MEGLEAVRAHVGTIGRTIVRHQSLRLDEIRPSGKLSAGATKAVERGLHKPLGLPISGHGLRRDEDVA